LWEDPVEDVWEVHSQQIRDRGAQSGPRWLPEVPPTPRYEEKWFTRKGDGGVPVDTPPWRPGRQLTPRYVEPERPIPQPDRAAATAHQAQAEEPTVVLTEVPADHVSPPTPATTIPTGEADALEKGPWVWPEPPATYRPPLQRRPE